MIDPILAFVTAPSILVATVALLPRRVDPTIGQPVQRESVRPAHLIDDDIEGSHTPERRRWVPAVPLPTLTLPKLQLRFRWARKRTPTAADTPDLELASALAPEEVATTEVVTSNMPEHAAPIHSYGVTPTEDVSEPIPRAPEMRGDVHDLLPAEEGPTADDFARFSMARELEELRHKNAIAELQLQTAQPEPTLWISALAPDVDVNDIAARLRVVHHLALLPRNSFAPALLIRALDSEPEPFVRARMLGALAATDSLHPELAAAAADRSDIEAAAVADLMPSEPAKATSDDSQDTVEPS